MKNINVKEDLELYGVYMIKNIITNDCYIGSTIESFKKRLSKHISDYNKGITQKKRLTCPILYNSFCKYNLENFEFIILKKFKIKKDSIKTKNIVRYLEEKLINKYNPKYNICKKPTLSGCPNLGRKLSKEWKLKIGNASKKYSHSKKTLEKITKNNKENSSLYKVCSKNDCFIGTLNEAAIYFKVDVTTLYNNYNKKYNNSKKQLTVLKLKSQTKKIKIFLENTFIIFNSFSECDKHFNMWRGFTSTQVVNNKKQILNYNYEIINDDIV